MKETTDSSKLNEKWVESTLKKLTKWIAYKTYNADLPASPEDIAVEAITYAIMPALEGKTDFPSSSCAPAMASRGQTSTRSSA